MIKPAYLCYAPLLVAITLAACTLTPTPTFASPSPEAEQASTLPQPTELPSSSPLAAQSPSPTITIPTQPLVPTELIVTLPSFSPTPVCNRIAMGKPGDVTIPDGTELMPGQAFTKVWRLVNKGSCTWTPHYAVIWFSGEQFGAPTTTYLSRQVPPNQELDLSLDMLAPDEPGAYQSNWKLESPEGELIGIGPGGNSPFWVRILVVETSTPEPLASPQPSATTAAFVTGIFTLHDGDRLDLNKGLLNPENADGVQYKQENGQNWLALSGGATMAVYGASQPLLEQCQVQPLTGDALKLDDLAVGNYLCYRTGQGLPGWSRLVYLNGTEAAISLEITTWMVP